MEILPSACHDNLRRFLRRRRYQRLGSPTDTRKRLKIARLGGRGPWRSPSSRRLKLVLPIVLLAKLHKAYVEMMIRLAGSIGSSTGLRVLRGRRAKSCEPVHVASTSEKVDGRLLMEFYNRLVSNRTY